jgi:iron complex outermembrane recepter protein
VLEEIVVQARKRAETLFDIPESIAVLSSEALQRAGVSGLDSLGRQTPNIILNRRQDNEPNVVIRGVGAFGNTQGVGFYIDDVQNFTDQSARIEDVERVEILKGPQGTIYGGSNIGGAVRYITRKPQPELSGEAHLQVGEQGTRSVSGVLNAPLSEIFLSRVSAYTDRTDGFIHNNFLGGNIDESSESGARAAFRYLPSDRLDMLLTLRYSELENGGNVYLRTSSIDDVRRYTSFNEDVRNERKVGGGIFQLDYDAGGSTLTSVSSFTRRDTRFLWDLDYSEVPAVSAVEGDRHHTDVITQELRLTSNDEGPFNWLVGLYGARIDNKSVILNAVVTVPTEEGRVTIENFNDAETIEEQYALFVDTGYEIGKFNVDLGARLNRANFEATLNNVDGRTYQFRDTSVLPKASLTYHASDAVMIYGMVAKGYEPGKINTTAAAAFPFEAESALSYELGIKGRLPDVGLNYELTGFFIAYDDRQFETQQIDPDSGVVYDFIDNIGDSESYGVEAAATWRPIQDLTFGLSAGYLHSTWKTAVFQGGRFDGNDAPYAPEFTGNASIDYTKPITSGLQMSFRADYSHQQGFYWDIRNLAKEPAHDIVGARIAIGSTDERWELALRAENLFDERYWTEFNYGIFEMPDAQGRCDECHAGATGPRRRILATFDFRF